MCASRADTETHNLSAMTAGHAIQRALLHVYEHQEKVQVFFLAVVKLIQMHQPADVD